MSAEPEVLQKPVPFGKYCLLEKISTGGMAEVFKAKQFGAEGFERLLAVKRILDSIAEDETFIEMFIDEAKIASQLNHPNIAQTFDLGKVEGSYFIALEYISGKDLRTLWEHMVDEGLEPDIFLACFVISEVCKGLQYAHFKRDAAGNELHIVHRDISPQNILISFEGEAKIIDFGIAKAQGKTNETQVGILKGKFSYMSPEQVRGLHIDHRADVFALGIVLYEMLTLQRLFLGESDFATLEKIRKVEMSPPTLYNPFIPRELEDIVLKALAKSPDDRFQSGEELREALEVFMRNHGSLYGAKDLAASMGQQFAGDIEHERRKLDQYQSVNMASITAAVEAESGSINWGVEESDTAAFTRGNPFQSFEDISPAADVGIRSAPPASRPAQHSGPVPVPVMAPVPMAVAQTVDAPTTPGVGAPLPSPLPGQAPIVITGGAAAPDVIYKNGASQSGFLPGVDDLGLGLDEDDDDPTMEFDRFKIQDLIAPVIDSPRDDLPSVFNPFQTESAPPPAVPPPVMEPPPPTVQLVTSQPVAPLPPPVEGTGEVWSPAPEPKQKQSRSSFGIILGLVGVIVMLVLVLAAAAVLVPRLLEGTTVSFQVQPADLDSVEITVDGEVAYTGPASKEIMLEEFAPGSRVVTVKADGYNPQTDTIEVRRGANVLFPVKLTKVPEKVITKLSIAISPKGSEVTLDGKALGAKDSLDLSDLKPGTHRLLVTKKGYQDDRLEFYVREGETKKIDVSLEPARFALVVGSKKGVAIEVFKREEGAPGRISVGVGQTPLTLDGLDARHEYDIVPEKAYDEIKGYKWNGLGDAKVELSKGAAEAPIDKPREPKIAKAPKPREPKVRDPKPRDPKPKDPKPRVVVEKPKGTGTLVVAAKPQAQIFINGKSYGYTPKTNIKLSSGRYRVKLVMQSVGKTKTYTVNVKPNATVRVLGRP
jgi:serine/threonine protein kinase